MRRDRARSRRRGLDNPRPRMKKARLGQLSLRAPALDTGRASERYQDLMRSAPFGYVRLDREGRIREINLVAAEIIGVTETASLEGRPLVEFVSPPDRDVFAEAIRRSRVSPGAVTGEFTFQAFDGRRILVRAAMQPARAGDPDAVWIVVTDLADRRELDEARYFDLFNAAPVGYVLLDRNGVVRESNQTASRLLGVKTATLIGRPFILFVAPASRSVFLEHIRRVRSQLISVEDEMMLEARDGRRVPVHVSTKPSPTRDHPEAAWTVLVDLTEQQHLQDAHRVAERERLEARHEAALAKARSDAKDRFLATLSHELRTPLTPALNATTLLLNLPELPSEGGKLVTMIRRNIELEVRLIDDLLDVTRIGRNKLTLDRTDLDFHGLLRDAVRMMAAEASSRSLAIVQEFEAVRFVVHADPIRLRQVVWNLFNNAMKFTPPNGRIIIRTSNDDAGALRLSVADTGIGFDSDALPRLFAPFEQATARKGNRGLGLGLAISRGIIEAHGGRIWAHSPGAGMGSTFEVELATVVPALQATRPSASAEAATPRTSSAHVASHPQRVLVVEDDPDSAQTLSALLSLYGHSVSLASSLAEGISLADRAWDIIITDLGLPDGSGLTLGRHVRSQARTPKSLIALSGFGAPSDIEASRQAGFDIHLTKPADIDRLLEIISAAPR